MSTISTPIFKMFFIRVDTFDATYIPPNKVPTALTGMNPAMVIRINREIAKRLIDFLPEGVTNISAIRMSNAATTRSNS
jgi:hypothetical protein